MIRIRAKDFKAMCEVYYDAPAIIGTGDGTLGARVDAQIDGHQHWAMEMHLRDWPGATWFIRQLSSQRYWATADEGKDYIVEEDSWDLIQRDEKRIADTIRRAEESLA